MRLKIENNYSDGHESTKEVEVAQPNEITDDWWEDVVYDHTGDGHYVEVYEATGERLGSCYTATVVQASNVTFLGLTHEWVD